MEDIKDFISSMKNKNTVSKTKSDIKIFATYKERINETRAFEAMSPRELDFFLSRFFFTIKKSDGSDYEPGSLFSMQGSMMRHLKDNGYKYNLKTDPLFCQHRDVLKSKMKSLKQNGKGLKPNKSDPFTPQEIEVLHEKKILGKGMQ